MILIDKSKDFQTIILTLSELSDGLIGEYVLKLNSDSDRKEYSISLPENNSLFPERFDLFNIETSVFESLNDGFYSYAVLLNDVVIERGKAQVKSPSNQSDNIIQPNSSNEILIYGE